eukprot:10797801-Heterocapsa_arctica.AAC.1
MPPEHRDLLQRVPGRQPGPPLARAREGKAPRGQGARHRHLQHRPRWRTLPQPGGNQAPQEN